MVSANPSSITNQLIDSLPKHQVAGFLDSCSQTQLTFNEVLYQPGDVFRHVYFPLTGFISRVARTGQSKPLEVGMIGKEGMLGATLALGVETAPGHSVVQGAGLALRMPARRFRQLLVESPALHRVVNRYLFVQFEQLAQMATCSAFHEVPERLAKWLLLSHDRSPANHLQLTHAFLADMLGVRRSAVSIAAADLQAQGIISYSRGQVRILDRRGLEDASCECYAANLAFYEAVLQPQRRSCPD